MSGIKPLLERNLPAAADQSSSAGRLFKVDGNGRAAICDTVGELVTAGVLLNKPDAIDKRGSYGAQGVRQVYFAGVVTAGQPFTTNASGEAILATYGDFIAGYAEETTAAGGMYHATMAVEQRRLGLGDPTFTIGAESANVINVAVQFVDELGNDVDQAVNAYLSLHDDAAGQTAGTAHSTSPAIGSDGLLAVLVTDLAWMATSEADGDLDINFTDDGAQTVYLKVVLPDGRQVMSDAITHAA